ncbi:MAG TPA: nickel pincer cofactor biosynthesis protein LarC [Verrucomicrobiae bacterium]|nr:nickel pincer cofactor biosynthesis protein LarC [Verrucomicrobiae bacterium]
MRGLYLDGFSGVSGDMLLGALVDLGVEVAHLRKELRRLPVRGFDISARRVERAHLGATKVDVEVGRGHQPERRLRDIRRIVEGSSLSAAVRGRAMQAFERLVKAEARVHRMPVDKVHLHEVGAVDAIVDVVGTMIGLEALGWPRVVSSPLQVGRGTVTMEHGTFPVPPPAVTELLRGRPIFATELEGELVTPTGAAIVTALATDFGPLPAMRLQRVGHGAGTREYPHHPNVLRLLYGDLVDEAALRETVIVIQTTIDDMNPQIYGHLMERLFDAGALEVFYAPIQMKKNRPGTMATIICPQPRLEAVTEVIFRETTTIGFRYLPMGRIEMDRRFDRATTPWGVVRVKVSRYNGRVMQATPEYEDCRALALKAEVPLKDVQQAAATAWREGPGRADTEAGAAARATRRPRTRPGSARRGRSARTARGGSRRSGGRRR